MTEAMQEVTGRIMPDYNHNMSQAEIEALFHTVRFIVVGQTTELTRRECQLSQHPTKFCCFSNSIINTVSEPHQTNWRPRQFEVMLPHQTSRDQKDLKKKETTCSEQLHRENCKSKNEKWTNAMENCKSLVLWREKIFQTVKAAVPWWP